MRIAPLIGEFRNLYPDLKLEILLTDANLDLVTERVDLAIRLTPGVEADVVAVRLCYTPYRVCAAPGVPGAESSPPTAPGPGATSTLALNLAWMSLELAIPRQ